MKVVRPTYIYYIYIVKYIYLTIIEENCGEIIFGLALLNISLRFLRVLLFLKAPAAFRSHAETSLCICMYVCMEKSQTNSYWKKCVHNLGCFAARFVWSYSLGNLTLRTFASWIWIWNTHTCLYIYIYTYLYCIYIYISLETSSNYQ